MCCHRVISLLQSALLSPARRRVQDDASSTVNDEHRPQQVQLITDENEDRPRGIDRSIYRSTHAYYYAHGTSPTPTNAAAYHTQSHNRSSVAQARAGRRG